MILTLFAFGTFWFWLFVIAAMSSIIALIENEKNVLADIVFIGSMFALYKMGCDTQLTNIGSWIYTHWFYSILIFIGYLFAGTAYSLIKWAVFVADGRAKLIRKNYSYYEHEWKPGNHKNRITHWMIYWPISGIWTLLSNPVVKAFNRIFYKLEGVYDKIAKRIMKDLIEAKLKNK